MMKTVNETMLGRAGVAKRVTESLSELRPESQQGTHLILKGRERESISDERRANTKALGQACQGSEGGEYDWSTVDEEEEVSERREMSKGQIIYDLVG